nr:MAG TPA: hypothetical protein [Caudoviricetes sp.]
MFLLTIYEEGERGKKKKRRIGGFYKFIPMYIVSLYLCIWMERPVSLPMYIGVEVENFGGKGEEGVSLWIFSLSFCLGFYLQYMGISFLRTPVARPVGWRVDLRVNLHYPGMEFPIAVVVREIAAP